jgi:NAD(P)-dependent dehydrogenase (short-subunit alcohol dehydrogenase family)
VVLADVELASLESAGRDIAGIAGTFEVDVSSAAACARMVADRVERHGGLDVIVTAAGVWVEGPSETMTERSGTGRST